MSHNAENDVPLAHICEVCGTEKVMTPDQAFAEGWDYPPRMGAFGVLSARTCGTCPVNRTLWWRVAVEKRDPATLTAADLALIERVKGEPESIRVIPPAEKDEGVA